MERGGGKDERGAKRERERLSRLGPILVLADTRKRGEKRAGQRRGKGVVSNKRKKKRGGGNSSEGRRGKGI